MLIGPRPPPGVPQELDPRLVVDPFSRTRLVEVTLDHLDDVRSLITGVTSRREGITPRPGRWTYGPTHA